MKKIKYQIKTYSVELYAIDKKGVRTRWGDRVIRLYAQGREVGQAVFGRNEKDIPEPYLVRDKIFYFAHTSQYEAVIDLLRHAENVYIVWKPIQDPKEPQDGDAFFLTQELPVKPEDK